MNLKKNKSDDQSREFWEHVEKTAKEVEGWPAWKKGNGITCGEYMKPSEAEKKLRECLEFLNTPGENNNFGVLIYFKDDGFWNADPVMYPLSLHDISKIKLPTGRGNTPEAALHNLRLQLSLL